METLKKLFPYSFKEKKDVAALIINILIYVVVGFVAGVLMSILGIIPIVNILVSLIGGIIEIYIFAGIVISILDYLKVLK